MKKLSAKTIEALDRIGSVIRVDTDAFDEEAADAAMESFFEDREILEDVAELLLQLSEKPEVMMGFNAVFGFIASAALGEDGEDDTVADQVEHLVGPALFSIAKEALKRDEEKPADDEPV